MQAAYSCKQDNSILIEIINPSDKEIELMLTYSQFCSSGNWTGTAYAHVEKYEKDNTYPFPLYGNGDFFIQVSCKNRAFLDRVYFEYHYANESVVHKDTFYVFYNYYKWPQGLSDLFNIAFISYC
jgi:hypothetical protein